MKKSKLLEEEHLGKLCLYFIGVCSTNIFHSTIYSKYGADRRYVRKPGLSSPRNVSGCVTELKCADVTLVGLVQKNKTRPLNIMNFFKST